MYKYSHRIHKYSARAANSASSSYANGMSKDRYNVRPKKKLSWDPRPPHVYIVTYSLDELASRKAHWRQVLCLCVAVCNSIV